MSDKASGRKRDRETSAKKPSAPRVRFKCIPKDLQDSDQWVLWAQERRKGKWTKVPYSVRGKASADDPATWDTIKKVVDHAKLYRGQYDGVGYVFAADDPYTGIDLDDAIDPETSQLKPWAKAIVDQLNSYTEISPSETGVKIWVKAKKPSNDRSRTKYEDGEVEMYDRGRYFAMTGLHWPGTPATIEERQAEIDALYARLFPKQEARKERRNNPGTPQPETRSLADDEVVEKAQAEDGGKFARLMAGDTSDYGGDASRADMALACKLAFWTDKDAAQMDRIFRSSALMRPKWDERRGESTYGEQTIAEACTFVTETYRGSRPRIRNSQAAKPNGNGDANGDGHAGGDEEEHAKAGEVLGTLLEKVRENVEQAIEDALQAEALHALAVLALDDAGRVELFYRELRKANGKSRDIDGLRRAVNQERKRLKQERIEQSQRDVQSIPRSFRILTNYDEQKVRTPKGTQTIRTGRQPAAITLELLGLAKGWPRRVQHQLFAEQDHAPLWLDSPAALFAWIHNFVGNEKGSGVYWTGEGENMVSRAEFHAYLSQSVENYLAVEAFPHWPTIPEHYYLHPPMEGGDGEALRWLLHRFRPATLADHDLILALFLSLFWGGAPGTRPAWLITSDEEDGSGAGRGVGKSFLAQFAADVAGGYVAVDAEDKMADLKKRLLSPQAITKRVLLLDNLKTLKFSWAQLESLITERTISGHQMFEGEGTRPNTLTTIITLNGASLSKDMAQRCVIIKLKRPKYSARWEEETRAFIQTHRWAIIGDIIAQLQKPSKPLEQSDRWASWGLNVLSHVDDPAECAKVIQERRGDVDEDSAEGDIVREYIVERLREREHAPEQEVIFIPSAVAAEWVNGATGERRAKPKACAYLNQLKVKGLKRSKHSGRGFVWEGSDVKPGKEPEKLKDEPFRYRHQEHYQPFR